MNNNSVDASLTKNLFYNIASHSISFLIPLVLAPYVSRILSTDGLGEYSFGYSIAYYFSITILFGFTDFGTRKIALFNSTKQEYSNFFWSVLFCRILISVVMIGLYLCLILNDAFPSNVSTNVYLSFVLLLVGNSFDIVFLYQGLERFAVLSAVKVLSSIIYLSAILFLVKTSKNLLLYSILKNSADLIVNIFLWICLKKSISKPTSEMWHYVNQNFKEAFVFFIPSLVMSISPSIDQFMIGAIANNSEVAYYQQIYKITSLISSLIYALGPVALAKMTSLVGDKTFQSKETMSLLFHICFILIVPIVGGIYSINSLIVPLYFGDAYVPAIPVMYLFLPHVLFSCFASVLINSFFYPQNRIMEPCIIVGISVVLNILTNIYAIKMIGASGAALTSSFCCLVQLALLILRSKGEVPYHKICAKIYKPLFSSVIMVALLLILKHIFLVTFSPLLSVILLTFFGLIIYLFCLFILRDDILLNVVFLIIKRKRIRN